MVRIAKLGDLIYENFEPEIRDEQGNVVQSLLPDTKTELIAVVANTVQYLARRRLQEILEKYGYNSLGDVLLYANQNDTEAQAIQNWYLAYDDGVWNYINGLPGKTKTDILNDLRDLTAIEESIYQASIQSAPLP